MLRPTFPNALHVRLRANEAVSGQVEDLRERVRVIEPKVRDATGTLKEAEVRLGVIEPKVKDATGTLKEAEVRIGAIEPKLKDASGTLKEAEVRIGAIEPKLKDASGTLKDAEVRIGTIEPKVKDASGTLKDAEVRLGAIEPKVKDAAGTLKDAEGRLDTIEPKVSDASEDVTLGSLESGRNRLIAYSLLRDLIDQWTQTLCAPLADLDVGRRTDLLGPDQELKDSFDRFANDNGIDVPDDIKRINENLSNKNHWKDSLRDVFDELSVLRKRASELVLGATPAEPEATAVAGRNPARSRAKRTT